MNRCVRRAVPLLCFAVCGRVQSALAEPSSEPSATVPATHGARTHDGFYFRVANGFGALDERLSSVDDSSRVAGRNRGIVNLAELAFGGTVAPGWVVGGGIYAADLLASTFRGQGNPTPSELDPGLRNLGLLAPFVDVYLNPRGGFHVQGALGLATLTPRVFGHAATEQSEYLALGVGLMLGAGYEVWVSDEWSLGVLSRTTLSVLEGSDGQDELFRHVVVTSPGLLVSLTFH